ncbi:MAG: mannose-1-phosphate guanylyltransferase [Bacteroidales bacterium]|nr:mannose-1-phosphate guanylyltransferase [Bacteroidales bacterium]MCF8343168.1 mannose-1-phosphate guanylyltransferase [Bacteroidales bacterium]MCF8350661.1 mannose-1-phosphate guanylyltransferase [Bacteroidales bacterium]MCF8376827.1 mannose-1-phosphate guanylyltransferase [Bacteroidales bacterium]MCF8400734.1 mannose-1-phosphate guanylyltransferase [Bacteroidales bacterium]
MKNRYCIIMAGGIGSRFWPMSKTSHPKQFIDILGTGKTLIQQTFERFLRICPRENILIVTNAIYKDLVMDQLEGIEERQVLCEPSRKNTAPCIAYAMYKIREENQDAVMVVAPSDHIIQKENVFTDVISSALKAAEEKPWLLTLGIKPSRPDTGYGYIQFNDDGSYEEDDRIKKVKTFTEKPNLELAESFLESGDFLWNSGIFIWSLKSIEKAFEQNLPEVNQIFKDGTGKYNTPKEEDFINGAYMVCKNISIDYGVMEKATNVYVLASDFGWSDLGTWGSLYDIRQKNEQGNSIVGQNVLTYDTKNCIVNMPKDKLVVLQGLEGYIVVEDEGTLLICRKEDEQKIRQIVNDVRVNKGEKYV